MELNRAMVQPEQAAELGSFWLQSQEQKKGITESPSKERHWSQAFVRGVPALSPKEAIV